MLDVGSSCSLSLSLSLSLFLFLSLLVSAQGLHPSASGWLGGEKDLSSFGKGKIESAPEIKISRVLLSLFLSHSLDEDVSLLEPSDLFWTW